MKNLFWCLSIITLEPKEDPNVSSVQNQTECNESQVDINDSDSACSLEVTSSQKNSENVDCHDFDLGNWIGKSAIISSAQKREILRCCWKPPENYNFRQDAIDPGRPFIHNWLQIYENWLAYSKKLKGALCLFCMLFPPTTVKGILGAFIAAPFTRYQKMHESCRNHVSSQCHKNSTKAAKNFTENTPVDVMMVSGHQDLIAQNRKIISSIISTIIFCGTQDLPLRGKESRTGK